MNIFVLDNCPMKAAQAIDCVRVPKMVVESAQMMASALRRWGATDEQMPIAKTSGKPYRGGYKNHPCTIWAGDTRANYAWLALHALQLSTEYMKRFSKVHACHGPIESMVKTGMMEVKGPIGERTPFAQAMPDEYKHEDAVTAYRAYYHSKIHSAGGVHYRYTSPPDWWMGATQ